VGSLLLALIIGLLATLFVAKTWIRSKFIFVFLLASVIPLVVVAELFFHHPLLLSSGAVSIIGLFLLYLTSLIGITIADKHIATQLEILLRTALIPPQTLDLKTLDWLQQEQRDFIRYVWKLKLIQSAATHINYHISTTQHLEPNSHHTSDQNICS
jgi:hypothetical protein